MKKPDWKIWIDNKEECKLWLMKYLKTKALIKSFDEARLYLKKTEHNLSLANWLSEKHKDELPKLFGKETFYDWIITMYYYAVYHSALALISKKGYESKSHSASLCFLIYYFYHGEKSLNKEDIEIVAHSLSKEDIEILGFSKEVREKASYNVHESFEEKLAEITKINAVNFINKIKEILAK
jgi:uncharacterized protein (UPF0332 family)